MKNRLSVWLFAIVTLALPLHMEAQTIEGFLQNHRGRPIAAATVVVLDADSTFQQVATTDANGHFTIPYTSPIFILQIQHVSYESTTLRGYEFHLGAITLQEKNRLMEEEMAHFIHPSTKLTPNGDLQFDRYVSGEHRAVRGDLEDDIDEVPN